MISVKEDINLDSEIRKLMSYIDFKDEVELKFYDSKNQVVIQMGKKSVMIYILNKFSSSKGQIFSSEIRYETLKVAYGSNSYQVVYRSKNTIGKYTSEDYELAVSKLKDKIRSYLK